MVNKMLVFEKESRISKDFIFTQHSLYRLYLIIIWYCYLLSRSGSGRSFQFTSIPAQALRKVNGGGGGGDSQATRIFLVQISYTGIVPCEMPFRNCFFFLLGNSLEGPCMDIVLGFPVH